jgi:HSP20 family molecular chaperone IbpA
MKKEVTTIRHGEVQNKSFFAEIDQWFDSIRRRAYELFQARGFPDGRDWDDWFSAERELFWRPASELSETEKDYRIRVAVPGFQANQIEVGIEPGFVTVRGEITRKEEKAEGEKTLFSEFEQKKMFRRFPFPQTVNTGLAKATLDDGMLTIVAPKTETAKLTVEERMGPGKEEAAAGEKEKVAVHAA